MGFGIMNWFKLYTKNWGYEDFLLAAVIFLFPIFGQATPILIVALSLGIFIRRKPFKIDELSPLKPGLWFLVFFLVHLIGMLWTDDQAEGWNDIGMKLSLLAFPLIFLFARLNLSRNQLLEIFLSAMVVSSLVNFGFAIFRSIYNPEDNHWAYFSDAYFSFNMHRSYYAVYAVLGVIISMYCYYTRRKRRFLVSAILLTIVTVLTFSKVGMLLLIIIGVPLACYYFYRLFGVLKTAVFLSIVAISIVTVVTQSTKIRVRFEKMVLALSGDSAASGGMESNTSRVVMWEASLALFSEKPILGFGTGDVQQVLSDRNRENGQYLIANKKLNSHNQFLNTGVQLGLLGMIPLMLMFITGFGTGLKRRDLVLFLTVLVLGTSFLFESSLERQDGVIPTSLLILGLCSIRNKNATSTEKESGIDK